MPTIVYRGNGKRFSVTGGCLAVMGRNTDHAENIRYKMNKATIEEISTVTFKDILQFSASEDNLKYLDVFTAYMSMFPFMRCVKTPYEKILTTTDCTFDAVNYTQNEIMHAMFHIRQLAYSQHNAFKNCDFMLTAMYDMVQSGVPFWKAYTLTLIPFHINPRYPLVDFNRVLEADANTFMLKSIPLANYKRLVSGRKPKPHYEGGKISDMAQREKAYPQNITNYLMGGTIGEKTLYDLLSQTIKYAQEASTGSAIVDAFGYPLHRTQERYDISDSDLVNALDKALHQFGITSKGKITC